MSANMESGNGLFKPGLALMARLSGPSKFWVIAAPLLLAVLILTVLHIIALSNPAKEAAASSELWLTLLVSTAGVLLWAYMVLSFFKSNRMDRDHIDRVMQQATQVI